MNHKVYLEKNYLSLFNSSYRFEIGDKMEIKDKSYKIIDIIFIIKVMDDDNYIRIIVKEV